MKNKIVLGFIVTAQLAIGLNSAIAEKTLRTKPPMPPVPPGLVMVENSNHTYSLIPDKASPQFRHAVAKQKNIAGTQINEAAGAQKTEKKSEIVSAEQKIPAKSNEGAPAKSEAPK